MTSTPLLSIVVPAFNEQESLPLLAQRLLAVLRPLDVEYEIIVVDDGSSDDTWQVVKTLHGTDPRVLGLRFSRNFGHQNALLAGLTLARGRAVIMLDADLQHPPELIPQMLSAWRQGYPIVNAIRTDTEQAGLLKNATSRLFYRIFSWLAQSPIQEGTADFRLLDRTVVRQLRRFKETHLFLRGIVHWMGFRTAAVPFAAQRRAAGRSKYSWRKMLYFALDGITSFSIRPLRVSIVIGLVVALMAFGELAYVLVVALFTSAAVPGWASTVGVLAFLFGVLFILLGIIGEYIGRTLETAQARPRFLVADRVGWADPTDSDDARPGDPLP